MKKFSMHNRWHPLAVAILWTVGIFFACSAAAEAPVMTQTVEVIGTSVIYEQNTATAREQAIAAALSSAIEQVVSNYLPIESQMQNVHRLNDMFYKRANNFITSYKVLTESRLEEDYQVMVQATVSLNRLIEQLSLEGLMVGRKALPRVLFLAVEQRVDDPPPRYWRGEDMITTHTISETAIINTMETKGFLVLDRENSAESISKWVVSCHPDFDVRKAAELGTHLDSDVVILAKASVEMISDIHGEDIRSFRGVVSARAVLSNSGKEIAAASHVAMATNTDVKTGSETALAQAGTGVGRDLSTQIRDAWQTNMPPLIVIEVTVSGTQNLVDFVQLRRILKKIQGVRGMTFREITASEAVLAVDFEGTLTELSERLILRRFKSFGITISNISENRMWITIVPR